MGDKLTKYFYHGSGQGGIRRLEARSLLHGTEERVVYLTDSLPYALFYLWDEGHVGFSCKHVTSWVKDSTVYYEEQFPGQLKAFYQGAGGYLYRIAMEDGYCPVEGRETMYYVATAQDVEKTEYISDVYAEILRQEALGTVRILRFEEQTEERKAWLTEMVAEGIRRANYYAEDPERAEFMKRYFPASWQIATA